MERSELDTTEKIEVGKFLPEPQPIQVTIRTLITAAAKINLKSPLEFQGLLYAETARLQAEQSAEATTAIGDDEGDDLDLLS